VSRQFHEESTVFDAAGDAPTLRRDGHQAATLHGPGGVPPELGHGEATLLDGDLPTVQLDGRVPERLAASRSITVITSARRQAAEAGGEAVAASARSCIPAESDPTVPADPAVRYVVVGLAGRGGMGTVHVAHDVDLLRRVALKELSEDVAEDRTARARFVREVQVTAQLDHPHIVPVYGLEVASGKRPAYAMKLVEGRTFAQLIAETRAAHEAGAPRDVDHALPARIEHFLKVCDALAYAHARGVVHRDLKPANLMLGRHNEVYVMDWGVCRLVNGADAESSTAGDAGLVRLEHAGETAFGTVVGTPLYMSPEQAQGRHTDLDARSDQCALGLILFELVTLARPFRGRTVIDILQQASSGQRTEIEHAFGEPIPGELVAIIARATAVNPADRYATVDALADDLRRYLRGDAVLARPDTRWQKAVRALARHRQTAALLVLGFALVSLATIAGLLWRHDRAIEAQRHREARIQAWVRDVADQGDRLQTRLLEVRGEFEALAAGLAQAAEFGRESAARIAWTDSAGPSAAAASQAAADHLDGAFGLLPGASRAGVEPLARRLVNLRRSEEEIFAVVQRVLGSGTGAGVRPGGAAEDTGLHELRAAFDSGLLYVFPAAHARRGGVDPRTLSWYTATATPGVHWTLMQADADAARELALSTAVVDANGRRVGAVSLVLALDHVLENLVREHPIPDVSATILLVRDGAPLAIHTTDRTSLTHDDLMRRLPLAEIAAEGRPAETGVFETDRLGGAHLVAYDRIHPLDWTIVATIEARDLFR
jgi:serine/threonine-protein kinase